MPTTPPPTIHNHRIALLGNPNTGKTTLFNRLTGLRHHTANFPGTTLEARIGSIKLPNSNTPTDCIDLPGLYALNLTQLEAQIAQDVLEGTNAPKHQTPSPPDAVCIVVDASNLARNLVLVAQVLSKNLPTIIAVNMTDVAQRRGLTLDLQTLSHRLNTPVIPINARSGQGIDDLTTALANSLNATKTPSPPHTNLPDPTDEDALAAWAERVHDDVVTRTNPAQDPDAATNTADRILLHPILGLLAFTLVMGALFYAVFSIAAYPMEWIEHLFTILGGLVSATIPEGIIHDFLSQGVVAGVGATVVFLPQICLLFFLISLLEASGYLARGAFIIDRLLRPFGLSGHAFVPFLSSHACALPGIMATRAINDPKERLAAILTAPFMSCTARIPVYVLLVGILFPESPAKQTLAFAGAYLLGIAAGLLSALIARRTILKGNARPMALELPTYKRPSLRSALTAAYDKGLIFLKKAGTIILAISIILWWLSAYPNAGPSPLGEQLRQQADDISQNDSNPIDNQADIEQLLADAEAADNRHQSRHSFVGRLGATIEPVLAPLGYDRQLAVGVIASFAAREVFVTTMAVQVAGSEEVDDQGILTALRTATRDDGITPIFTTPVCWSLLVYYVLAMQCLPTLVVTAKESGNAKWAALQLIWMLTLAYSAALLTYQLLA